MKPTPSSFIAGALTAALVLLTACTREQHFVVYPTGSSTACRLSQVAYPRHHAKSIKAKITKDPHSMSLGKTRDGVEVHVNTMVSEWPGCIRVSTRRHDRPIAESYVRVPARPVAVVVDSGGGIVEQKSPTPPQNWVLLIVADTERCYMVWNTPLAGANPRFIGRKHGALTYAAFALRRENAGYFFTELGSHHPLYHLPDNG